MSLFRQNFVLKNLNGFISGQVLGNVGKMYGYSSYICLFWTLSVYISLGACACVECVQNVIHLSVLILIFEFFVFDFVTECFFTQYPLMI